MKRNELKQLFRDYFTFNKTERKGFTVLGVLLAISLIINYMADKIHFSQPPDFSEAKRIIRELEQLQDIGSPNRSNTLFSFNPNTISAEMLDSLDLPRQIKSNLLRYRQRGGSFKTAADFRRLYGMNDSIFAMVGPYVDIPVIVKNTSVKPSPVVVAELFPFDPNTASPEDLERIGLNSYQRRNLISYRERGGKFVSKSDVSKIYGMDDELYAKLEPWIDIPITRDNIIETKSLTVFDINQADSLQLIQIPGIGPAFSGRILRYRQILGGFHSVEQIMEVFGMTTERFEQIEPYMTINNVSMQQIRINFADLRELRSHPYISAEQARQIIQLRSDKGPFNALDELQQNEVFDKVNFEKVKPYLTCR
jgi:DNA uptake protein ComE-like DNA-binding protein